MFSFMNTSHMKYEQQNDITMLLFWETSSKLQLKNKEVTQSFITKILQFKKKSLKHSFNLQCSLCESLLSGLDDTFSALNENPHTLFIQDDA